MGSTFEQHIGEMLAYNDAVSYALTGNMDGEGSFGDSFDFTFDNTALPTTISPSQLMLNGGNTFGINNAIATPPAPLPVFQGPGQGLQQQWMAPPLPLGFNTHITPPAPAVANMTPQAPQPAIIQAPPASQLAVSSAAPAANLQWQTNNVAATPSKQSKKPKAKKQKTTPVQNSGPDYNNHINAMGNNHGGHGLGITQPQHFSASQQLPQGYQPSTNPAHARLMQTLQGPQLMPPQANFGSGPVLQTSNPSLQTPLTTAPVQQSHSVIHNVAQAQLGAPITKRKRGDTVTEPSRRPEKLFLAPNSTIPITEDGDLISPFTENFLHRTKEATIIEDMEGTPDQACIDWEAANAAREVDARVAATAAQQQPEDDEFAAISQNPSSPTGYDFSGLGFGDDDALLPGFEDDVDLADDPEDEVAVAKESVHHHEDFDSLAPDDRALYQALRAELSAHNSISEELTATAVETDTDTGAEVNVDDDSSSLFGDGIDDDTSSLFGDDTSDGFTTQKTTPAAEPAKQGGFRLALPLSLPQKALPVSDDSSLPQADMGFVAAFDPDTSDLFGNESYSSNEYNFDGTPRVNTNDFEGFDLDETFDDIAEDEDEFGDEPEQGSTAVVAQYGSPEAQQNLYNMPAPSSSSAPTQVQQYMPQQQSAPQQQQQVQYTAPPQQQMQYTSPPQQQTQYTSPPQQQQLYTTPPQQFAAQQQVQQPAQIQPAPTAAGPNRPLCPLFLASNGQHCPYGTACLDRHYFLSGNAITQSGAVGTQVNYMALNAVQDQDAWQEGLLVTSFKRGSRFICKNCHQEKPVTVKNDGVRCTPCFKRWCNGRD